MTTGTDAATDRPLASSSSTTTPASELQLSIDLAAEKQLPDGGFAVIGTHEIRLFDTSGNLVAGGVAADADRRWAAAAPSIDVVDTGGGTVTLSPAPETSPYATGGLTAGQDCVELDRFAGGAIETCRDPSYHSNFGRNLVHVGPDGQRRTIVGAVFPDDHYPGTYDTVAGHWADATLSPDGTWIAAQWSGECEVPIAFLVRVADGYVLGPDGAPLGALAPDDQPSAWPQSTVLGWSDDKALVSMSPGACGAAPRGAVLAVDPEAQTWTDLVPLEVGEDGAAGEWVLPWGRSD